MELCGTTGELVGTDLSFQLVVPDSQPEFGLLHVLESNDITSSDMYKEGS